MPELLIKTKDDKIYKGNYPIHAIMIDELGIDFNDVIDVGFISRNRYIWCNRKPH